MQFVDFFMLQTIKETIVFNLIEGVQSSIKDIEPLDYVVEWNKMFLKTGPCASFEYNAVGFRWTMTLANAQAFSWPDAKARSAYYNSLDIPCCVLHKTAAAC